MNTTNAQTAFWNSSASIQRFRTISGESSMPSPPTPPPPTSTHTRIRNFDPKLIITPVTADIKKPARRDYIEQMARIKSGKSLVWDDSKHNKCVPGDKFGFWFYKDSVHVHTVIAVDSPLHRLSTWSENVGQGNRNVVTLSQEHTVIPWDKWIAMNGAKRCMGTAHVKKGLTEILEFVN